jgi:hypothetical protein
MGRMRLLLVEDTEDVAEAIVSSFARRGDAIDHAATVEGAVDMLAVQDYDVAILDIGLPDGSGTDAGRVATYDIEASGLGYLFADSLQATTFGSLIDAFGRAGAVATCCSAEIIEGVAEGRWHVAYNVLGSYALARADDDPRLVVVLPEDYVLVLARAAMIPRRAPSPAAAAAFIDFLLSPPGREALAETRLIADLTRPSSSPVGPLPIGDATLRPIALSPVLLLGLDREKRAQFLARRFFGVSSTLDASAASNSARTSVALSIVGSRRVLSGHI